MDFTTMRIAGADAIQMLDDYRRRYPSTGQYPFLIGESEELERIQEAARFNELNPASIIRASLAVKTAEWIAGRRKEAEEYELTSEETFGEWPGEILEKGSISLWEHYWYCADIVDQGCGSVANLAATLLNSAYWYFWWD